MKIAIIGATGNAGSRIVTELLSRGHQVLGIARHPDKMQPRPGLTLTQGDIKDEAGMAQLLTGQEAAIHSIRFQDTDVRTAVGAAKKAGLKRFLVVGGAGSLEVAPGSALDRHTQFPARLQTGGIRRPRLPQHAEIRARTGLDLSFSLRLLQPRRAHRANFASAKTRCSPAPTGKAKSPWKTTPSRLPMRSSSPQHSRQRFTVGY